MIITISSSGHEIICRDTRLKELELFNEYSRELWEMNRDIQQRRDGSSSYFQKSGELAILRSIVVHDGEPLCRDYIVSLVFDEGLMSRKWSHYDRDIENSQGGTTNFSGWCLQ